jgi:hypothetical protein
VYTRSSVSAAGSTLGRRPFRGHQVNGESAVHPPRTARRFGLGEQYRPGTPLSIAQFFHHPHENQIYNHRIVREAIEIELHLCSINREGDFCASTSWMPLIDPLQPYRTRPMFSCRRGSLSLTPAVFTVNNRPPSSETMNSPFVLWAFNKPTPLPATPTPLCIIKSGISY